VAQLAKPLQKPTKTYGHSAPAEWPFLGKVMISNDRQKYRQQLLEKMVTSIQKRPNSSALSFAPITNAVTLFREQFNLDDLDDAFGALSFRQQRKFNALRARANGRNF
jgi:hypothetical protein